MADPSESRSTPSPSDGFASEILVDARGLRCPAPTLRLQRALRTAGPRQRLRLLADDPMARIDVPHLAAAKCCAVLSVSEQDGVLSFLIETPPRSS
jgi:tRNA 2-thiouridine synthesizing protein A